MITDVQSATAEQSSALFKLSKRMRIGYVVKRFPRFSETFIVNEILHLESIGVEVTVFSLLKPSDERRHEQLKQVKAQVIYLPRQRATEHWAVEQTTMQSDSKTQVSIGAIDTPLAFEEFFAGKSGDETARLILQATTVALLAEQHNIDHLHAHFASNPTTVALLAGRLANVPFSFTAHARDIYHCYVNRKYDNAQRSIKMQAATFVVTVSDYNKQHLQSLLPDCYQYRVKRLYNGVDLNRFQMPSNRNIKPVFIAVGRLVEKKGFVDLVTACKLLCDKGYQFNCKLIGDGPLRPDLAQQIVQCNLESIVSLEGALTQNEVTQQMGSCAAMVLPCVVTQSGDRDGLPTVLLEAMAMGLATISTTTAGVPEIIENNVSGLLVAPKDTVALADAMASLLDEPEKAIQMGENGRERADLMFNSIHNVQQLADWFDASINQHQHAMQSAM